MKQNKYLAYSSLVVACAALFAFILAPSKPKTTTVTVAGHIMVPIPGDGCYMGKTEVTQAQWEAVMEREAAERKARKEREAAEHGHRPIV